MCDYACVINYHVIIIIILILINFFSHDEKLIAKIHEAINFTNLSHEQRSHDTYDSLSSENVNILVLYFSF